MAMRPLVARLLLDSGDHYVAQGAVPASLAEWSIPIDQLGPEGRKNYQYDTAEARRLLAAAGIDASYLALPFLPTRHSTSSGSMIRSRQR